MSFITRLFGGCTAHHFEIKDTSTRRKISATSGRHQLKATVNQKVVERCVHDGCDAERERWRTVGQVTKHDLYRLANGDAHVVDNVEGDDE